ncbi:HXXEE domain-containing protein [Bacillus gaemokensis]|uniref:HXXEE domain-containing protein n=1 Tax=Bacillus gaemokensis TaxID=574375 RepID=UPI0022366F2C|nr:HXXEE domain-containing protein [Bacillus gaemokensis]
MWFIPILFAVHNAEEYYFFSEMRYIQLIQMEENVMQRQYFFVALCLLTMIVFLFVCAHFMFRKRFTLSMLLIIQAMIFMNGWFHIGGAILTGRYVPGFITSLILIIPFSLFLFRKGIVRGWWKMKHVVISCLLGVVLLFPIIFGVLFLAKVIV